MAAVLKRQKGSSSPSPGSHPRSSSPVDPTIPSLPPLMTAGQPVKMQRVPSYAKNRLSTFSTHSNTSQPRSRPQSTAFPAFHSSLNYTLVRDFAYPAFSPLFYGPVADPHSAVSTPASEAHRRLSDPVPAWDGLRTQWSANLLGPGEQLPQTSYGDGPPYSEDEDLHSPVVTSAKQKRPKSNVVHFDEARGRLREYLDPNRASRTSYHSTNNDGSKTYYISEMDEDADGPGGEYVTYPSSGGRNGAAPTARSGSRRMKARSGTTLSNRTYDDDRTGGDDEMASPMDPQYGDEHRYSRNYQFTIVSADEEMHGKAVALFDFERENENELPLVEGQVILVSYRHGQGWLVAQDPKTGESGLVPEEYVRLLRDIEGGWSGLMNGQSGGGAVSAEGMGGSVKLDTTETPGDNQHLDITSPISPAGADGVTPTQKDQHPEGRRGSSKGSDFYPPIVSTFSTSSKDFNTKHIVNSQPGSRTPSVPSITSSPVETRSASIDAKIGSKRTDSKKQKKKSSR